VAEILNNTPPAILGFRTPKEVHENIDPIIETRRCRVKLATPVMNV
jgi:hypothetical protein